MVVDLGAVRVRVGSCASPLRRAASTAVRASTSSAFGTGATAPGRMNMNESATKVPIEMNMPDEKNPV